MQSDLYSEVEMKKTCILLSQENFRYFSSLGSIMNLYHSAALLAKSVNLLYNLTSCIKKV